jgi:hypothetical protein
MRTTIDHIISALCKDSINTKLSKAERSAIAEYKALYDEGRESLIKAVLEQLKPTGYHTTYRQVQAFLNKDLRKGY